MSEPLRHLPIDLEDLALAWERHDEAELGAFLDGQTGAVVVIPAETSAELDRLNAELEDPSPEAYLAAIDRYEGHAWQRDALREALRIEEGLGSRFIRIPHEESRDAYRDMEEFVETVRDRDLHERLSDAIRGRGAFRRFKDVLASHPAERERWFAFQLERLRERIVAWLAEQGIAPSEPSGTEAP